MVDLPATSEFEDCPDAHSLPVIARYAHVKEALHVRSQRQGATLLDEKVEGHGKEASDFVVCMQVIRAVEVPLTYSLALG